MLITKQEKFVCPKCSREFNTKKGLTTHKVCCIVGRAKPNRKSQTEEAQKNISNSLIGKKLSREHVESLVKSHTRFSKETRMCAAPDCNNTFECASNSEKKYCSRACANKHRESTISKILPREMRTCQNSKCKNTFVVSIHSTQKYCSWNCSTKNSRKFIDFSSKERNEKISNSVSNLYLEGFRPRTYYDAGWITLNRLGQTIYHRSSYEKNALILLDTIEDIVGIQFEAVKIPYVDSKGIKRFYIPDFLVTTKGIDYLIEVKPKEMLKEENEQLKIAAGKNFAEEHNMKFLVLTEDFIFSNNNGSTTESLAEVTLPNTAAILNRMMIQSDLHKLNMQRQVEMTCPPVS